MTHINKTNAAPLKRVFFIFFYFFATALVDLLFIGFPGYHLSHEMRVQLDYTSHTCINLHVYNDKSRYYLTEIL